MEIIKKNLFKLGTLTAALALTVGLLINLSRNASELDAYSIAALPTTIDLNDCEEQDIRDYYADLNSLDVSERQGTNLLKHLKTILSTDQQYYSYDSNTKIWQMYEITDRDWDKSPASSTVYGTYNSVENKIYNYVYGQSESDSKNNPYIHALYVNREIDNQTTAWDDHNQDAWGINQEHIWAKSHGFDTKGSDSSGGARGDPMHLQAGNGWANHEHSNYFFAFVDKDRAYSDAGDDYDTIHNNLKGFSLNAGGNETVFEPQDCDKGDIARAIFYVAARYNNYASETEGIDGNNPNLVLLNDLSENSRTGTSAFDDPYGMGLLSDLLAWNKLDPVDEYEVHRNNLLYKNYTNNRNPFIDFPNWADAIWGTADLDGTNYNSTVTTYASPNIDPIGSVTGPLEISDNAMEIVLGDTAEISAKNALDVISWTVDDDSIVSLNKTTSINKEKVTISALNVGSTTITASCDAVDVSCTVTVRNPTPAEAIERKTTATSLAYHYEKEEGREPTTDVLDRGFTDAENNSNYVEWMNDGQSGVTYSGVSAGRYDTIQLSPPQNAGIVCIGNSHGTNAVSITITCNEQTEDGRKIDIYGSNSPYTGPRDLYSGSTRGTKLGSIVKGTSTTLTISENYQYIGIRANAVTVYISSIEIEWSATPPVYDYSNVSIRFGGSLTQELWNDLDTDNHIIQGFGVMIATDDVVDNETQIRDLSASAIPVESDPDVSQDVVDYFIPVEDLNTIMGVSGDNYFWNLRYVITDYEQEYVAAAYIKTSLGYVFFKQTRYSVKAIAADYIANRGYDSTTAEGSLSNLANI